MKLGTGLALAVMAAGAAHGVAHAQNAEGLAPGSRPNLLLIVADDLGYLDLGLYGSEIRTPNIDALAGQGMILTNYYTSVACQPTRAMLMSGASNHMAGVGAQGRAVEGNPYYRNYLSDRVVTIADRMGEAGYHTYMSGKWHLGSAEGQTPAERGFERSFVLLDPGASHFEDMNHFGSLEAKANYQRDGVDLEALPEGFYSTINYTEEMMGFIDEAAQDDAPFFGYLAYTTPHWPIHALPEDMEKTAGRYDEGWDVIRERRLERYKELGFMPEDAAAPGFVQTFRPWDELSDQEKAESARTMEAFAAMVERMDIEIGRIVDHLRAIGELDNTVIMFMSDNGAEYLGDNFLASVTSAYDNSLDNIGHPNSYTFIGPGWGEAGSAPYYLSKGFLADGGNHVPAFVYAPALGVEAGREDAVIAAFDVAPTFLELAGADPAAHENEPDTMPITGRSFADVLRADPGAGRGEMDVVSFEHGGQRAIRRGDWKALWLGRPNGAGTWQLFDLASDPGETVDVAAQHPAILRELAQEWDEFQAVNGVMFSPSAGGAAFTAETDE